MEYTPDLRFYNQIRNETYRQISETPPLTEEAEQSVFARIRAGDPTARQELSTGNMRLALYVAREFDWSGIPFDDLFQTAFLGLMQAAEHFDPAQGFKFSTYAVSTMKNTLWRVIQDSGRSVHIPEHTRRRINEYNKYRESYFKVNGRNLTDYEAAAGLCLEVEDIEELRILMQAETSFEQPIAEDNDGSELTLADITPGDGDLADSVIEEAEREELNRVLHRCVDDLPEDERAVINEVYFHNRTVDAWADSTGRKPAEARRLHRRGLEHLRSSQIAKLLRRKELIAHYAYNTSWSTWKEHYETSATEFTALKLIEAGV